MSVRQQGVPLRRGHAAVRHDLAKELDALIDRHLENIGAIVPPRNSAHKPKGS